MSLDVEIDANTLRATVTKPGEKGGAATWDVAPDQIEQHLKGLQTSTHPWRGLAAGDVTALTDAAAEASDERARDARNQ
jgi:hypothetical protein